jgi:tRNA (uracil-5-)-methyltransferase TRM9
MESATVQRLNALTREFYEEHAETFADSRPRLAEGVRRVLAQVPPGARVLEVGCGDGKAGRWLARQAPPAFYLGVDGSEGLLERARRYSAATAARPADAARKSPPAYDLGAEAFVFSDLAAPDWAAVLPALPFDVILAFAVLHHLPRFETRARLVRELAGRLALGGRVAMSNWQFLRSSKLRQHVVPWSALGLSEAEVEPGDYLLSWERQGRRGLRYVHQLDEAEARRLAQQAGLRVLEVFSADGVSRDLAQYVVLGTV